MKNKRIKVVLICIIMIFVCTFLGNILISFAATSSELQQQHQQTQNDINDAKNEQQEIRNNMSAIQKEVDDLNSKISSYQNEIYDLTQQIEDTIAKITSAENELDKTQKNVEEKQELLKKRLIASYKLGDTTYLDVLLSSDGLTDFLSKYYYIEQMAEADTRLIETIKETKVQIEESKKILEDSKLALEDAKKNQELKKESLDIAKSEKNAKYSQLSEEEKALQQKIEEMQAEDTKIRAAIAKALKEEEERRQQEQNKPNGGGSSSTVSPGGYIWPLPAAYTKITTGLYYSWGGYHGAVDFGSGGINGQPVYAVKDGTVILTQNLTNSYGTYVMINHHDGTYTLYAHGQRGSITVSEGQKVKQGQQIMKVGTTGNSTGPHLHFEVRLAPGGSNNKVSPYKYLPI